MMTSICDRRPAPSTRVFRAVFHAGVLALCAALAAGAASAQLDASDACDAAPTIGFGTFTGDTSAATPDGSASCGFSDDSPDVWLAFTAEQDGLVQLDTAGSGFDTVLSVHGGCPGFPGNELACNDNGSDLQSFLTFDARAGETVRVRISGFAGAGGPFQLTVRGGGSISGTVTQARGGAPLAGAGVYLWNARLRTFAVETATDAAGHYRFDGLRPDLYYVHTRAGEDYLDQVYDGVLCVEQPCGLEDLDAGTALAIGLGADVPGIDFALERGGRITGIVRDAASGEPLPPSDAVVTLRDAAGNRVGTGLTGSRSRFAIGGLRPGVYFASITSSSHAAQVYDGLPCRPLGAFYGEPCDLDGATPIPIEAGETVQIEFLLRELGAIEGRVTDRAGMPLPYAAVQAFSEDFQGQGQGFVEPDGSYRVGGLPPGRYRVHTVATEPPYLDQAWEGVPCVQSPRDDCDPPGQDLIDVDLEETVRGIDFMLGPGGEIRGTVHGVNGQPIAGAVVRLFGITSSAIHDADATITGPAGRFAFPSPAGQAVLYGTYFAAVESAGDFLGQVFGGGFCAADRCDPAAGTAIAVEPEKVTRGVDFVLERGATIRGTVRDAAGEPIENADVHVVRGSDPDLPVTPAVSDGAGRYAVPGLEPDTYFVYAGAIGFAPEIYDGVPCAERDACAPATGTPIELALGETVEDVDFALTALGRVRGEVRVAGSGAPAAEVEINAWNEAGETVAVTLTDLEGRYELTIAEEGRFVLTAGGPGFAAQMWDGVPCPGLFGNGCDLDAGTPVEIRFDSPPIEDVDFELDPVGCASTETGLCLNESRFRISARWRTPAGAEGHARGHLLTGETGVFWFFRPDNLELIVKVLDACERFDRFWVFAAGLTNLGIELAITDGWTGETRIYRRAAGTPFAPIQDTGAFATCDAVRPPGAPALTPAPPASGDLAAPVAEPFPAPGPKSGFYCYDEISTALCFVVNRFVVDAVWRRPDGSEGSALGQRISDRTGIFWFFRRENVELMVKVLDNCAGPTERYWFFAAGLTNLDVTLRIFDTFTGEFREYHNPLSTPFQPILDTDAFRCE